MRKLPLAAITFTLALNLRADSSVGPVLQWVKTFAGTGDTLVTAASVDSQGNFYILGNTTALDLPVTQAAQPSPGASTLSRVTLSTAPSTAAVQKIYGPDVASITSIAADPQNPQSLYATAPSGPLHSADAGATWAPLPGLPPVPTPQWIAIDPTNGSILYACASPGGVFKSADGGMTWSAINTGISPATNGSLNVYRVWIDPHSPQVLLAASDNGTARSTDGGATWTMGPRMPNTGALSFDPFTPGVVYMVFSTTVYKSTDDGVSFAPLGPLPSQTYPSVVVPDPLQSGVLYAGTTSGIYRSADGGATWALKLSGTVNLIAADPKDGALYAAVIGRGLFRSTDGFSTSSLVETLLAGPEQIQVAGPYAFVVTSATTDVYVAKLDSNGNVIYATYFGGSGADKSSGLAVGKDGGVYVTGTTNSADFPVTPGAYANVPASASGGNFIFKLQPDGSLAWSTFFADARTIANAIAVDSAGNPYLAGLTSGSLPTTAGAYVTQFQTISPCGPGNIGPCPPGPTSAFLTKFKADGTGLVFSTYIPQDLKKALIQNAQALVLDPNGNAYLGGGNTVYRMNSTGSALLASTGTGPGGGPSSIIIDALALDSNLNVYATGAARAAVFPATSQAFQTGPLPAIPSLPAEPGALSNAFVMKWDSGLTQTLAATLLGGEMTDAGESVAIDPGGNVIVSGYSDSKAFPTQAPFQASFSPRSGFVAGLDSSLSNLLFSTYLGDSRPFDAHAAVPDGNGNLLVAGSTLTASSTFLGGDNGYTYSAGGSLFANKVALPRAPAARLDSVVNYASRIAGALSPGEAIAALGSGFGPDAQLLIDGMPLPLFSHSATALVAVLPDSARTSGAVQVMVSTGGVNSNPLLAPAAAASPGIFTVDGSGVGQGYILNSDGTVNSPSNPAAVGSAIAIFATGVGSIGYTGPYAVPASAVSVFVDGFYANGIAAINGPVSGQPGLVFQLSVFVPDPASLAARNPNLLNFKMPPQVRVALVVGAVNPLNPDNSTAISQLGLVLSVKQ